jgi:ribonuclease HI
VILFCDGAARDNPKGPAGAGALLLNEANQVVGTVSDFLGVRSNNEAEYQALIRGLEKALDLGARQVSVRADSEVMIRHLNGEYRVKAPNLRPLYAHAVSLLGRFESWNAKHVPRDANRDADRLANEAIDRELSTIC